ncbi:MAG: BamA/TamA family outer membrane protein [Polyangiaceae bacterium]|nr:BamA/TamA family outer membrane protein [Polyangiaceae bacterium]
MALRLANWLGLACGLLFWSGSAYAQSPKSAERSTLIAQDTADLVTAADLVASDPTTFTGKAILRVETVTVGPLWPAKLTLTSVRPGEPWSGEAGRRVVREALATGNFARATVSAYPENDGVVLRVALLPRRVIDILTISGGLFDRNETFEVAGLSEGGEVTAPLLERAETRIANFYASRGYPSAVVSASTTDTDAADRAFVSVHIEPGPPLLIEKRSFSIDPMMESEIGTLRNRYKISPGLSVFETILTKLGFGITPGARADENTLNDADRDLAEVLRENGFLRAEVRHSLVKQGKSAEVVVRILSGPRLVPVFDGNRAFDSDQLAVALDIRKSFGSRAGDLADRLRDFYVKRGFLDAEVTVTERGGANDAVHYLAFRIIENHTVRVIEKKFPCLTGDLSESDVEGEIRTFLDEDVPRNDGFSLNDGDALNRILGPVAGAGRRAVPLEIDPNTTYVPDSYERARTHLRDLFYSKGYLNAIVGPVSIQRQRCDPKAAGQGCVPIPIKAVVPQCRRDDLGLPLPEAPLPPTHRCEPDPTRGVECSPEVTVFMPIHLGPRSQLSDMAFEGNVRYDDRRLAEEANLKLGNPVSSIEVEAARLRLIDFYQERGYAYVDVRSTIEASPDRTHARAKFQVAEREAVIVRDVVIRGAKRTDERIIRSRIAVTLGLPYNQKLIRLSEERIAALGTFTSVSVSLEDPEVPQREKRLIVTVVEQLPQYLDPRVGFSTGEGFRFAFEYGNRNLVGGAELLTLRLQLSYLPDVFVPAEVLGVYRQSGIDNILDRLERRNAASLTLPNIGLGPLVSANVDLFDIQDLQRDYRLRKEALVPSVAYRPTRQLNFQGSVSAEYNEVKIFTCQELGNANPSVIAECAARSDTLRVLRVPEGQSVAFSQRVNASYDGRNNPFSATSGILLAGGVEHVNALPLDQPTNTAVVQRPSHFLKLTGKVNGYIPLGFPGLSLAMSLSGGWNVQLEPTSLTYPDRLFFLGGVDSIRSFLADSVVPQDVANCISNRLVEPDDPDCLTTVNGVSRRIQIQDVPIRGGDLMVNSRLELRFPIPVTSFLQGGLFLDAGNLWRSFQKFAFNEALLRYGFGIGVRVATPIGPIAFDYAFNLRRYLWEDIGAFQFSIGVF